MSAAGWSSLLEGEGAGLGAQQAAWPGHEGARATRRRALGVTPGKRRHWGMLCVADPRDEVGDSERSWQVSCGDRN